MICKKCGEDKPLSDFYNDKHKPSGKKPRCKPCDLLSRNKEKRREYENKYWSDPKKKEEKKKRVRRIMSENKERYAEKRREYLKTDSGRSMYRKQTQKRYAMRKAAFVEDVSPIEIFNEQGGICYLCNKAFTFKEMELDHVNPIARGGKHEKSNCKMACRHCNRSKGSKTLEELSYQVD